jgi:hypothetical protein
MAEKTLDVLLRAVNGEITVFYGRFQPDLFRTIDPLHGSIARKKDNKPMRPWWMIVVFCIVGSGGRSV